VTSQLIHDVQIVHPFLGSIDAPDTGVLREVSGLPAPDPIVQLVLHGAVDRWVGGMGVSDERSSRARVVEDDVSSWRAQNDAEAVMLIKWSRVMERRKRSDEK
jgi:hypothetical protein